jgi:hypothetical protein
MSSPTPCRAAIAKIPSSCPFGSRSISSLPIVDYIGFMPIDLGAVKGHAIADKAEAVVASLFHRCAEVTAHIEPAGINHERHDAEVYRGSCCPSSAAGPSISGW